MATAIASWNGVAAPTGITSYDGIAYANLSSWCGVTWPPNQTYIEDVFSTYLYTGNGSTQTITTGVPADLVWGKLRGSADHHLLCDTTRGAGKQLFTDTTGAQTTAADSITAISSTGFSLGADGTINANGVTAVAWSFAKKAKFFDIQTYTGTGSTVTINHNLGITPGMIIIKATDDATTGWIVWHRSLASDKYLRLETTQAELTQANAFLNVGASSFQVGNGLSSNNTSGKHYIAYLFAHDTASTGLIQCGSVTTDGSGLGSVSLGWEPQLVITKGISAAGFNWETYDNMRGWKTTNATTGVPSILYPNLSTSESTNTRGSLNATGFTLNDGSGPYTYIYLAIRRGPMKLPTVGTQVYSAANHTADNTYITQSASPGDLLIAKDRSAFQWYWSDRLRGWSLTKASCAHLHSDSTEAEALGDLGQYSDMTSSAVNGFGTDPTIQYSFRRYPGVFDVVCYTGTGSAGAVAHNLTVAPELMIVKIRNQPGAAWAVYCSGLTSAAYGLRLNTTAAQSSLTAYWNSTAPTSTAFSVGNDGDVNNAADTYVAYLFATLAGISKVGSYTGNGSSLTLNMGFAAGARFFLVKATSTTGNWWVFDSTRGIIASFDPALALNSTAAEVTSADACDPDNSGIIVNQEATCSINANGVSYIYLGIA